LFYNNLTAALFAEPDYRYFHFTELLRITISRLGVALALSVILAPETRTGSFVLASRPYQVAAEAISALRAYDFLEQAFQRTPLSDGRSITFTGLIEHMIHKSCEHRAHDDNLLVCALCYVLAATLDRLRGLHPRHRSTSSALMKGTD
jgi:hypothetical protein